METVTSQMLLRRNPKKFTVDEQSDPVPVGVFYRVQKPTYDQVFQEQVADSRARLGDGDLQRLVYSGDTWKVQ